MWKFFYQISLLTNLSAVVRTGTNSLFLTTDIYVLENSYKLIIIEYAL